jgi:glycosyltransferase involved in cell wall biosynthesis
VNPGGASSADSGWHDLVVCSLEAWDEVWRRNQFLVSGLLAADPRLRVLFVEPPTDPLFELSRRRPPSRARGLRRSTDADRLWTLQQSKIAPRRAGQLADRMLTRGVVRAARRLGMRQPLLWVNDPSRAAVLVRTGWPALYDITDDWLLADRSERQRERIAADERVLMQRCAAVVVCSPQLQRAKGAVRPVTLIPNAVDVEHYRRPAPRPDDLPAGRCAVYVGTLHEDRLDVELCVRTVRTLPPGCSLVLVGPDALSPASRARLAGEPDVVLAGARPYAVVPGYLQHADVLLVPHLVTDFTDSLDPIKLYEYLAVGRPVVSTPVAGFRERADAVTLAASEEFPQAVAAALDADAESSGAPIVQTVQADRPAVSVVPSWGERVAAMRAVLDQVMPSWSQ